MFELPIPTKSVFDSQGEEQNGGSLALCKIFGVQRKLRSHKILLNFCYIFTFFSNTPSVKYTLIFLMNCFAYYFQSRTIPLEKIYFLIFGIGLHYMGHSKVIQTEKRQQQLLSSNSIQHREQRF